MQIPILSFELQLQKTVTNTFELAGLQNHPRHLRYTQRQRQSQSQSQIPNSNSNFNSKSNSNSQIIHPHKRSLIARACAHSHGAMAGAAKRSSRNYCRSSSSRKNMWMVAGWLIAFTLAARFSRVYSWTWKIFNDEEEKEEAEELYRYYNHHRSNQQQQQQQEKIRDHAGDFDMATLDDEKGQELVDKARSLEKSSSCWHDSYRQLFSSCKQILSDDQLKSRLAWLLSDCFLSQSGRRPLPYCPLYTPIHECLRSLDDSAHKVYLAFFIDSHSMCHHLQSNAFRQDTERIVNELKDSATWAVERLEKIDKKSEWLLEQAYSLHESLGSIDARTEKVIENTVAVDQTVKNVMSKSTEIYQKSQQIIDSQFRLRDELMEEQARLKESIHDNMAELQRSYVLLGQSIGSLQTLTEETQARLQQKIDSSTEKLEQQHATLHGKLGSLHDLTEQTQQQLGNVADSMSSQLNRIQSKADDIGNAVSLSLQQQKQLLDGQTLALQGLQLLKEAQAEAFEESRLSLQKLSEDAHRNQQEFMAYQEELLQSHKRLAQSSNAIMLAQEAFESKQTTMLMALDRLFSVYNTVLRESRTMKACLFYLAMVCVLYVLTSTKQTRNVRAPLYFGLCTSFAIEFFLIRLEGAGTSEYVSISSKIFYVRSTYLAVALFYLIYSLVRYRDYELLNYKLLLDLHDKLSSINGTSSSVCYKDAKLIRSNKRFGRQLIPRSTAQGTLIRNKRKLGNEQIQKRSTLSFLDIDFEDADSTEDPDYEPSTETE